MWRGWVLIVMFEIWLYLVMTEFKIVSPVELPQLEKNVSPA